MTRCTLLAIAISSLHFVTALAGDRHVLEVQSNPRPDVLPTLGVWQEHNKKKGLYYTNLSAKFPNVPDFQCDLWCFESSGIQFASARELEGGKVELSHTWDEHEYQIVTTATPHPGALEIVSRLAPLEDATADLPSTYPNLNICWQLRQAPDFASEPEPYPEFVRRCFIFTESGRTFLLDTHRRPIPVKPAEHKRNNPPWVQMYSPRSAPDDLRGGPEGWADYSTDRFTVPVIGAVSRDRKSLTAIASGSESTVCQAWHDCMHNNARWLPASDSSGKEWRVRIYAMQNDPEALLERFHEDFPNVQPWQKKQK